MSFTISHVRGVVIGLSLLLSLLQSHIIMDFRGHGHDSAGHPNLQGRDLRHSRIPDDVSEFPSTTTIGHLPPSINQAPNGTIVVQLSGEMGNHLHKLAFARGLQLMAKSDYNLDLSLVLRHKDDHKWNAARRNLQKCFPNLRHLDFAAANTPEFDDQKIQQRLWLGAQADSLLLRSGDQASMAQVLNNLQTILTSPSTEASIAAQRHGPSSVISSESSMMMNQNKVTLPYVLSDIMVDWHVLDRYRDELLQWLQVDFTSCCPSDLPDPDETVFHFRNFVTELHEKTSELGFDELSPNQTANELLGHLIPGDKVAITTRFDNQVTRQYVQALQANGLQTRVVAGHSATQDFCFLMKAHKELVGSVQSTFFIWAAFLGVSKDPEDHSGIRRVRSYSMHRRVAAAAAATAEQNSDKNLPRQPEQLPHRWNDSVLTSKWTFQVFDAATSL